MRRGLAIVGLALVAGCGGSEPERGGVLGVQHAEQPRWATPAEVRWLGKVARWSAAFARTGAEVAAFENGPGFDTVLRGHTGAVERYRRVLAPIRACGETFGTAVGRAPTLRLRDSERGFRDSCTSFRQGVDLMLRALDEQDPDVADRAREAIEEAARSSAVAAGTLPPGEKQALPRRGGLTQISRVEPRLSRAAAAVADKDVEVRCWSARDWRRLMVEESAYTRGKVNESVLGFASAGGARLSLAPAICRDLTELVYRGRPPVGEARRVSAAVALVTLAHESVHLAGVADEATAECHGIQHARDAADALGVGPELARELTQLYWSRYERIPAIYRSPECRDGGELDLRSASSEFP